ncbi:MAG: NosD domain-containing protein, partial [Candidatus Hodarchaeota archaeon]
NNIISGNTVNSNMVGIYLYVNCNNNAISGNTVNNNSDYGIYLDNDCDKNNITENYIYFNTDWAIKISSIDCDDNVILKNILVSEEEEFIDDEGTNTLIYYAQNYFGITPPSFIVEVISMSFTTTEFVVIIKVKSELSFGTWLPSIQMWWDGIIVPPNNIAELGNGLYNVSLTPIFVESGGDPILLNMTISAFGYEDKYFEINIAVDLDTFDKEKPTEEFPLAIIIIIITSILGGTGAVGVSIILLRKRKRISKVN